MSYLPFAALSQGPSTPGQPTKTYMATQVFSSKLFNYSTSVNSQGQTVGSLVVNPNATALLCPANDVLHTNGRFLRPETHPNVDRPLIGVYSPRSFLSGFIDPTDPTFARYDVNFPAFNDIGVSSVIATLGGQGANVRGGRDASPGGYLTQGSQNGAVNAGDAVTGIATIQPTSTYVTVNSSQCTVNSYILLTKVAGSFSTTVASASFFIPAIPSVTNVANGSFRITLPSAVLSGDQQVYQWLIVK